MHRRGGVGVSYGLSKQKASALRRSLQPKQPNVTSSSARLTSRNLIWSSPAGSTLHNYNHSDAAREILFNHRVRSFFSYSWGVPRPNCIQLGDEVSIPILYEDRSVLAIDKPVGWMLVPYTWDRTGRNLQLAISSSILGGEFWARSRSLKFLKHVHRLDADTSGVLLMAKSQGALESYSAMFETRKMNKRYLAVVRGGPKQAEWTCDAAIGPDPSDFTRHKVDPESGKPSETHFRVLKSKEGVSLIEARPVTGRTHQIRIHLASYGLPIVGDRIYGSPEDRTRKTALMGLRAVGLEYQDPFQKRRVKIEAPAEEFLAQFL